MSSPESTYSDTLGSEHTNACVIGLRSILIQPGYVTHPKEIKAATALYKEIVQSFSVIHLEPPALACWNGDLLALLQSLRSYPSEVWQSTAPPLLWLAIRGSQCVSWPQDGPRANYASVIDWLIRHGAHINEGDIIGRTPLHQLATYLHIPAMMHQLLSKGADPNQKDRLGKTAMHLAVEAGQLEAFNMLLDFGGELMERDSSGFSVERRARIVGGEISGRLDAWKASRNRIPPTSPETASTCIEHECSNCGVSGAKGRCRRCMAAHYCRKQCQEIHWLKHRGKCVPVDPNYDLVRYRCGMCGQGRAVIRCSRCRESFRTCSRSCQKEHWSNDHPSVTRDTGNAPVPLAALFKKMFLLK